MPSRKQPDLQLLTWYQFDLAVAAIAHAVKHRGVTEVYGPPRGGAALAVALSHRLRIPYAPKLSKSKRVLWVDDIVDTGATIEPVLGNPRVVTAAWYMRRGVLRQPDVHVFEAPPGSWLVFPWECPEDAYADAADFASRR